MATVTIDNNHLQNLNILGNIGRGAAHGAINGLNGSFLQNMVVIDNNGPRRVPTSTTVIDNSAPRRSSSAVTIDNNNQNSQVNAAVTIDNSPPRRSSSGVTIDNDL